MRRRSVFGFGAAIRAAEQRQRAAPLNWMLTSVRGWRGIRLPAGCRTAHLTQRHDSMNSRAAVNVCGVAVGGGQISLAVAGHGFAVGGSVPGPYWPRTA
jgi:hypothetical protein